MAKKKIITVEEPKVMVKRSDLTKINGEIETLRTVLNLLDDVNEASDDLKTIGFLVGKAYAMLDRTETQLLETMEDIDDEIYDEHFNNEENND